jgi:hypothetical protein
MSWSDPCSECGKHRADCDCGDWCGYDRKRKEEDMEKKSKFTEEDYVSLKAQKEHNFKKIKDAEEELREIRRLCDHPETEFCTYSTRPGQYWENTEICSICGDVVNWPTDSRRYKQKEEK